MNKLLTAALIAAGLATAMPVLAQAPSPGADAPRAQHAQRHHQGQRPFSMPSERVEARLAYMKTALKITDAQQTYWNAFAEVQRKQAKDADQRIQSVRAKREAGAKGARPSAIDRLERRQQMMATRSQQLSETINAAKPLYAALSPEQKQIADRLLAGRGERGERGGFGRHGMHRERT